MRETPATDQAKPAPAATGKSGAPRLQLAAIEDRIDELAAGTIAPQAAASELLRLGEVVLEHWLIAHDKVPTEEEREGFRLLALHRQGAKGEPSFNACRETCRELAYHYNLINSEPDHAEVAARVRLAALVAKHLCLFVSGKLQVAGLGEFCCAAKPLRQNEQ